MSKTTQGFLALVVFGLLCLFFIAAWGTALRSGGEGTVTNPGGTVVVPTVGIPLSPLSTPNLVAPVVTTQTPDATIRYTVQPGEWLRTIALRYDTTVEAILALNPQITDPDIVTPGQGILIPVNDN